MSAATQKVCGRHSATGCVPSGHRSISAIFPPPFAEHLPANEKIFWDQLNILNVNCKKI